MSLLSTFIELLEVKHRSFSKFIISVVNLYFVNHKTISKMCCVDYDGM